MIMQRPGYHRPHRLRRAVLLCTGACCAAVLWAGAWPNGRAYAATLRPFSQIKGPTVHLADLFDDLGGVADRVLGRAPAPGERILVKAPQLAAIARDFDVDWRPQSGSEQAVIERSGDRLPRDLVLAALRAALAEAGAPADLDIMTPDAQEVLVPAGSIVHPEISQLSYDEVRGNFSAILSVALPDMPALHLRLSGTAVALVQTTVAARRLAAGAIVGADDVRTARVQAPKLRGAAPMLPQAAIGLTLRRGIAPGQPVTQADLVRTNIVQRGDRVRMTLVSDGLVVSAEGIAAQAGAHGDRIRVENPASHLLVEAEVTGAGQVKVTPLPATVSFASVQ
jgi:flagella basal body P-ring formation protein FlgA